MHRPGSAAGRGMHAAELIAVLWRCRRFLERLDADLLAEHAVGCLESLSAYESLHEIYCFIKLYEALPARCRARMQAPLESAAVSIMTTDPAQWNTYLPRPLDFADSPDSGLFPAVAEYAGLHCSYLAETCREGVWEPYWDWGGDYPDAWEESRRIWTAVLTIKNYRILQNFGYPV